jgi:hypothetical protein
MSDLLTRICFIRALLFSYYKGAKKRADQKDRKLNIVSSTNQGKVAEQNYNKLIINNLKIINYQQKQRFIQRNNKT